MSRLPGAAAAVVLGLSLTLLTACGDNPSRAPHADGARATASQSFGYEVVNAFPHDPDAFTQGLIFHEGAFIESTGLNGASTLRRVEPHTGRVLQTQPVPAEFFAEGAAVLDGKIYQLTWRNQRGFIYDLATLKVVGAFAYTGEGWGLTTDGTSLILSDGTSQLRFLDPKTFRVIRTLNVERNGASVIHLNELEFIKGEIWANVWQTPTVVRIDPATGRVTGTIDFTGLLPAELRTPKVDVLNGIAYDATGDRLFVTGKNWPRVFEVKLRAR